MEYIKLNDDWKERINEKTEDGEPYRFVVVETEEGQTYSAELLNDKKLKMVENIDMEKIDDIRIR